LACAGSIAALEEVAPARIQAAGLAVFAVSNRESFEVERSKCEELQNRGGHGRRISHYFGRDRAAVHHNVA